MMTGEQQNGSEGCQKETVFHLKWDLQASHTFLKDRVD